MGIFGAMATAGKEIKKAVRRKLKKASGRPIRAGNYTKPQKKRKLPASNVSRGR